MLLVVGAWTEDAKIDGHTGHAEAKVVSVSFQRTLVRYQTPDGAEHIPSVGVLYPEGLSEGDTVLRNARILTKYEGLRLRGAVRR